MASPVPLNPLQRNILLEYETEYRLGTVVFSPNPRFGGIRRTIPKGDPALLAQGRERIEGRQFLGWARFPYAVVGESEGGTTLWLADARYVTDLERPRLRTFGIVTLDIPARE